jgi:hypothetical protein
MLYNTLNIISYHSICLIEALVVRRNYAPSSKHLINTFLKHIEKKVSVSYSGVANSRLRFWILSFIGLCQVWVVKIASRLVDCIPAENFSWTQAD